MIKTFLLLLLSVSISFTANAQFWKKTVIQPRQPLIEKPNTTVKAPDLERLKFVTLNPVKFPRTRFNYDLEETAIMKSLYHTLRFRMYTESIASLNQLVNLYIEESRYSEAKWYLLQCNYFGHKSNNNNAVIASLINLGMLKADIGEYDQAKDDLQQAKDLCLSLGMVALAKDIDQKFKTVEVKRFANVKPDIQYAEVFDGKKG